MSATFTDYLSNLFPGRGSASARPEAGAGAETDTNTNTHPQPFGGEAFTAPKRDGSEHEELRNKRPRVRNSSLPEPEVISLLSSDEEDNSNDQDPHTTQLQNHLQYPIDNNTDIFYPGYDISSHLEQTSYPQGTVRTATQMNNMAAFLRQQKNQCWFSASAAYKNIDAAVRRSISHDGLGEVLQSDRSKFLNTQTGQVASQITGRALFESTLQPNLTGGALTRIAGGYGLSSGRIGGDRHFSNTPSLSAGEDKFDNSTPGVGMSLKPELDQQAYPKGLEHSLTIPNATPASSIPESYPKGQGEDSQDQVRIPMREPPLCPEQAELIDIILSGRNVFYTGSAGCGKSTALKAFTRRLRDRGLRVDIIAPTGISALGVGGSTTFVYAGWSLSSFKRSLEDIRLGAHGKFVRKRLKKTDVLVIDEISMVENFHFERLNAVMQEARNSDEPFGGVQVIVTGDFHQLPPVKPFQTCLQCGEDLVPNLSQESYSCKKHGIFHDEDKWAFKSKAWGLCDFVYFHLKTIHRQSDETFIKILQKCRIGQPLTGDDTDMLMNHPCRSGNATKLYARREEVRRYNQLRFDKLLSEKFTFDCFDNLNMNLDHQYLEKHRRRTHNGSLESLKDHRFEATVEFKKGMLVVLLTNLDLSRKLCNGSQGIICGYEEYDPRKLPRVASKTDPSPENSIHGDYGNLREMYIRAFMERKEVTKKFWPVVKFHNGEVRTIFAECSVHPLGNKEPFSLLSRTQIPLAPAWAMSIHKSQSLTLDRVIVDLSRAWEDGQVYVALSRATSLAGLKIEGDPKGLTVSNGNSEVRKFHKDKFGI